MLKDATWITWVVAAGLLGTISGGPAAASAEEPRYGAEYERCIGRANGSGPSAPTNAMWARCGDELVAREKRRMTRAWIQAYASLPAVSLSRRDLLEEQRAWIRYKDMACRFLGNQQDWGREGQVIHFPLCRARVFSERAEALESVIHITSPS